MRLIDAEHLKRWLLTRWLESNPTSDKPIKMADILNQIEYGEFSIDLVRCGECAWYEPRHIEENGIECAGQCIWHIGLKTYCDAHDREDPEDRPRIIIFREPTDFCSYGERRADDEDIDPYQGERDRDENGEIY